MAGFGSKQELLVYKIETNLYISPETILYRNFFGKDVQMIEINDYYLHFLKQGNRLPRQEKNLLVSFIIGESNKGDAWVYALHKYGNSMVSTDELGEFLRGKLNEMTGVYPVAANEVQT